MLKGISILTWQKNKNIEVSWMDYGEYKEYPQPFPPFEHGVTILDLLFNTGTEVSKFMKFLILKGTDAAVFHQ